MVLFAFIHLKPLPGFFCFCYVYTDEFVHKYVLEDKELSAAYISAAWLWYNQYANQ